MAGHDERRGRGALLRGVSRWLGGGSRRRDAEPEQVGRELVDVLAKVASDPALATLIASRAGFPAEHVPASTTASAFWSTVVERAIHGMASVEALVGAALEQLPHNPKLRELGERVGRSGAAAQAPAPTEKVTEDEFASLLDRHSPWSRFRDACATDDHLVMWVAGDPRQNIPLFYERIRSELSLAVEHGCYTFGGRLGDGTVAAQWAHEMTRMVPGYQRGMTLPEALRDAACDRPAMFLLDNQRGALEEAELSDPYVAELVEFITRRFAPAAVEAGQDAHPVRLFLGIQIGSGQRESRLAKALRKAMRRAIQDHGGGLGMWEDDQIELPTWSDVKASMEELLPRGQPLDDDELDALKREHDAFRAEDGGTLRQLAQRLYPLYERFHDARARSTKDGG
jgi:hypothetical protein